MSTVPLDPSLVEHLSDPVVICRRMSILDGNLGSTAQFWAIVFLINHVHRELQRCVKTKWHPCGYIRVFPMILTVYSTLPWTNKTIQDGEHFFFCKHWRRIGQFLRWHTKKEDVDGVLCNKVVFLDADKFWNEYHVPASTIKELVYYNMTFVGRIAHQMHFGRPVNALLLELLLIPHTVLVQVLVWIYMYQPATCIAIGLPHMDFHETLISHIQQLLVRHQKRWSHHTHPLIMVHMK